MKNNRIALLLVTACHAVCMATAADEVVFGHTTNLTSASQLDLSGAIVYAIDCRGDATRTDADRTVAGVLFKTDAPQSVAVTNVPGYMAGGISVGYDNQSTCIFDIGGTTDDQRLSEIVRDIWYPVNAAINLQVTPGRRYKVTVISSRQSYTFGYNLYLEEELAVSNYVANSAADRVKLYTTGDQGITVLDGGLTIRVEGLNGKNAILNAIVVEDLGEDPDAGPINRAFGKSVIWTSSEYTNSRGLTHVGRRVTDGSAFDPVWSVDSPIGEWLAVPETDAFFIVDLGMKLVVEEIRLINTPSTQTFKRSTETFEVWAAKTIDANSELVAGTRILEGTLSDPDTALVFPVDVFTATNGLNVGPARYLKFIAKTTRGTSGAAGLNEFQVYGSNPPVGTLLSVR